MEPVNNEVVTSVKMRMIAEIDYTGGVVRGLLHSQYLEAPYEFTSLFRMIEKMEQIFDAKKFPGAFMSLRTFGVAKGVSKSEVKGGASNGPQGVANGGAKKSEVEKSEIMQESVKKVVKKDSHGSKCTFEIMVRYRQNATWQGQIHWLEKNLHQNFRSVLEMLKLMDEALAEGEEHAGSVAWDDGARPGEAE